MEALKQSLDQKKRELDSLAQEPLVAFLLKCLTFLLGSIAFCLLVGGLVGWVSDIGDGAWSGGDWEWLILIGLSMMICAAVCVRHVKWAATRFKPEKVKRLEQEASELRKKLRKWSSATGKLAKIEREITALNPDRYGCKTTDELRQLLTSRRELMRRVLGDEETAKITTVTTTDSKDNQTSSGGLAVILEKGTMMDSVPKAVSGVRRDRRH